MFNMKSCLRTFAVLALCVGVSGACTGAQAATPMVASGDAHTCALHSAGRVACWGANGSGQLGAGASSAPQSEAGAVYSLQADAFPRDVVGVTDAVALAAYGDSSCAVLGSGEVRCWGGNSGGQLGTLAIASSPAPLAVAGVSGAVAVALGDDHACAILNTRQVQCWGRHRYNPFGNASGQRNDSPLIIVGIAGAKTIAASSQRTCVVLETGQVMCWGWRYGVKGALWEVGSNPPATYGYDLVPTVVAGLDDVRQVALGGEFDPALGEGASLCAVRRSGLVNCQTRFQAGVRQRFDGLPGMQGASSVALGKLGPVVCVVLLQGTVRCLGAANFGHFGKAENQYHSVAREVGRTGGSADLDDVVSLAMGNAFSCAVLGTGEVKCWGGSLMGVLGNGYAVLQSKLPLPVPGLAQVVALGGSPGRLWLGFEPVFGGHHCAVRAAGSVLCWGDNSFGQLGDGTLNHASSPVGVTGIANARSVVAGVAHTCALQGDQTVQCWGDNSHGQLGQGQRNEQRSANPLARTVPGVTDAVALAAGDEHTCALRSTGAVQCWGGQSTRGADAAVGVVAVPDVANAVGLATHAGTTCSLVQAQADAGVWWCWRDPVEPKPEFAFLPAVPWVVAGTCPVGTAGSVAAPCLNGTQALTLAPWGRVLTVTPSALEINPTTGANNGCALLENGTVLCAGSDFSGELGVGRPLGDVPGSVLGIDGEGVLTLGARDIAPLADAVFAWAERSYPAVFASSGRASFSTAGFRVRHYLLDHFLGVNERGVPRLYYKGPNSNGALLDLGLLSDWQKEAGL